jgi:hypothetical protein
MKVNCSRLHLRLGFLSSLSQLQEGIFHRLSFLLQLPTPDIFSASSTKSLHRNISVTISNPATRVAELYCPEHKVTVKDFMITPSMSHKDIIDHVEAAFRQYGCLFCRPCDINGEPLWDPKHSSSNLALVKHGERLLISVEENDRMYPEPKREVVLFLEDDSLATPLRVRTTSHLTTFTISHIVVLVLWYIFMLSHMWYFQPGIYTDDIPGISTPC